MEINASSGLLNVIESLNTEFSSQKDDGNLVNDRNETESVCEKQSDLCEDSTILEDQVNDQPQPETSSLQGKETSSLEEEEIPPQTKTSRGDFRFYLYNKRCDWPGNLDFNHQSV